MPFNPMFVSNNGPDLAEPSTVEYDGGTTVTKEQMMAKVKEANMKKLKKKTKSRSCLEKIKFMTTFTCSLIAMCSFSALMFLVPFIVDPALATLTADFVDRPVECRVITSKPILGASNCSWSSCREGCTRDIFQCHHILVEYSLSQEDYTIIKMEKEKIGEGPPSTKQMAALFVNVKGCGYPPAVQCKDWLNEYGIVGGLFPCYYARTNQSLAITHIDLKADLRDLLLSTLVPIVACTLSGIILCMMHTRCLSVCRAPRINDLQDEDEDEYTNRFNKQGSVGTEWKLSKTSSSPPLYNFPSSSRQSKQTLQNREEESEIRKRLNFHLSSGGLKRKADLFDLPTISKKVKTGERDSASSTEQLISNSSSPTNPT